VARTSFRPAARGDETDLMNLTADQIEVLTQAFLLFLAVGFLAQLIDGALGMAYGVISSSVLLAFGVPPAHASAVIHAAETFTTAASGASHLAHRNIDWRLFFRLAPAGIVGGVIGAYLLTGFDATFIKAIVIAYLGLLGLWMLAKALRTIQEEPPEIKHVVPLGVVGGFLDASGGGGWGPIVTSTLLGRGHPPRFVIGSVNTAEFLVTLAISATFVWTMITGRFVLEGGWFGAGAALAGLIGGGLIAAPLAGYVTKIVPARLLLGGAAILVIGLALWQGFQLWPRLLDYPITAQLLGFTGR
jgi:uncharacterized membrane protein YfcA